MRALACALATAVILGTLAAPAFGQSKTGTTIGQFLLIEPGARIAAMGNAGAAVAEGIQSVYYNPAALGLLARTEAQFTHSEWLAGIDYDYAAFAVPVAGVGTFFASVTSLNSGEIDVRTVDQPLGTGERYDVGNFSFGLGYGLRVTDRFAVGLRVNYMEERIWHTSLDTWTLDVGTFYRISESGLGIGSSLSNYGARAAYGGGDLRIQYDSDPDVYGNNGSLPAEQYTEEFSVPVLFRVGLSYPRRTGEEGRLLFAVDAFHPNDNTEYVCLGAEWEWKETLAFRAGYQDLFKEDSEVGTTLGLGFRNGIDDYRFSFDYGWADYGRLVDTHRVTFGLAF